VQALVACCFTSGEVVDHEQVTQYLRSSILQLETQADAMEMLRAGVFENLTTGFKRYNLVFLIRSLQVAMKLRNAKQLRCTFADSLRALFLRNATHHHAASAEVQYFIDILNDGSFPVPSPTIMSHIRFVLDCAFMLQQRRRNAHFFEGKDARPCIYVLSDSSPQGHTNWLMSECFIVLAENLPDVSHKVWRLIQLGQKSWEDDHDVDRVQEERDLVLWLKKAISHHVLPPVGLGSARCSLAHECHAFYHSLYLETGSASLLSEMTHSVTAVTTDKGTESGMVLAPDVQFDDYFPYFANSPLLSDCEDAPRPQSEARAASRTAGGDASRPRSEGRPAGSASRPRSEGRPAGSADSNTVGQDASRSRPDGSHHKLGMQQALPVHGLSHFINNVTKGIADAMPHYWDEVYPLMNGLAGFLKARHTRERFVETCLSSSRAELYKPLFATFPYTLLGWRFGSLAAVSLNLLKLEFPLFTYWNKAAFNFEEPSKHREGEEDEDPERNQQQPRPHSAKPEGPSVKLASSAAMSVWFWSWCRMFQRIADIIAHMQHWAEGCPCHSLLTGTFAQRQHELSRRLFLDKKDGVLSCPLAGRRAPELACGVFSKFVEMAWHQELSGIMPMLGALTAEDRQKVLADFEGAQQLLMFAIETELACWRQTPLVFCGIGHANDQLAKDAVAFGLSQWETFSDEEKEAAHVVTIEFCTDTRLHTEVLMWLAGSHTRSELPVLSVMAAKLILIPTNEMSVERLHSITHATLKKTTNVSASYISFAHRSHEFMDAICEDCEAMKLAAIDCETVYHSIKTCFTLGITMHPHCARFCAATVIDDPRKGLQQVFGSTMKYSKTVKRVVYHLDTFSQFLSHGKITNDWERSVPKRALDPVRHSILQVHVMEHFRQRHVPGAAYTVGIAARSSMQSFACASGMSQTLPCIDDGDSLEECQPEHPVHGLRPVFDLIAFQVLSLRPGAKKFYKIDKSFKLQFSDIAIAELQILGTTLDDAEDPCELTVAVGLPSSKAWAQILDAYALQDCLVWKQSKLDIKWPFNVCEADDNMSVEALAAMERVLQQCIDAGAMEGSSQLYFPSDSAAAEVAAITYMVKQGWAEVSAAGGMRLLNNCLRRCKVQRIFTQPQKVLSHELHLPVLKRSTAALLSSLFASGWELSEVAAGKSMLSEAPPYGPLLAACTGTARPLKKMYVKSGNKTIAHEYAAALVLAADMSHVQQLHEANLTQIDHFMPKKYYECICRLDFAGLQGLSIMNDCDDAATNIVATRLGAITAKMRKKLGKAKFRLEDSFRWGCVSFKGTRQSRKDGTVKWGLQCDCPRRSHMKLLDSGGRTVCTLSMTYSSPQERELVIRKLKAWVISAWNHTSRSAHHKASKHWVSALDVPSHDELESEKPEEGRPLTDIDDEELRGMRHRRQQSRPNKSRRVAGGDAVHDAEAPDAAARPRSDRGLASRPKRCAAAAKRPASSSSSSSSSSTSSRSHSSVPASANSRNKATGSSSSESS
jgi:hypothetical protein